MIMRKSPMHDTVTPCGQHKQDITLGDYIQRKEKQIREEHNQKLTDYERGYQDGYYDAIVDGKKEV